MQDQILEKLHLFGRVYPVCRRLIPEDTWQQLVIESEALEFFADTLNTEKTAGALSGYLAELARMEFYVYSLEEQETLPEPFSDNLTVNPTLELFTNSWKNLVFLLKEEPGQPGPHQEYEHVIIWRQPFSADIKIKSVNEEDLLAMKMALEGLTASDVAREGQVPVPVVESGLIRALNQGIVIGPEPEIKRDLKPDDYQDVDRSYFTARIFSLQWHITQACDLHCRHCYDRQQYKSLSHEQEIAVLDDLAGFCAGHKVHGQVTFTGGNPLLHPSFEKLYRAAAERGFTTAVLGNPAPREELEPLLAIQPPAFYQVSLEGLEDHNDYMRGRGHYRKVMDFLDLLRDLGIFSMVMLTLTRDNMDQVPELAERLSGKTDLFTFNRLSLVGEGANLAAVPIDKYPGFLQAYQEKVGAISCLGIKDNLLNILYHKQNRSLFGGCTGYGCGAAFNFITILADGSVHACRKFPSPLGNILDNRLSDIYHSENARKYRAGAAECRDCRIRPVCGGCLAVAYSHGLDIFRQKDPYCFIELKNPPV